MLITGVTILSGGSALAQQQQQQFKDYADVKLADLLQMDVTTASKVTQTLLETPVAVTVIDRDQIDASEVHSIAELFRDVVGMNVLMYDTGDYVVGMRGNFSAPTNNLLVLIDGKNTYQNFYGFVLWDALPISIDDIDRIEIIRGPASSLYGANAEMGVINIITRKLDAPNGMRLAVGTRGIRDGNFRLASSAGATAFRIGLSYRAANSFDVTRPRPISRVPLANLTLGRRFSGERSLTFFAGFTEFTGQLQAGNLFYSRLKDNFFGQLSGTFQTPTVTLRTYWNRTVLRGDIVAGLPVAIPPARINEDVWSAEYQQSSSYSAEPQRNRLVWGANIQANQIASNLLERRHSQLLASAFGQEEYRPTQRMILMGGVRVDHHPLTREHVSPRGSMTYIVSKRHAWRMAYGEAYRNPTIGETYGKIDVQGSQIEVFKGNPNLSAVGIRNLELGYRGAISSRVSLGATYYWFRESDTIVPGGFPPLTPVTPLNSKTPFKSRGLETEADTVLSDSIRFRTNYRWIKSPLAFTNDVYRHVVNAQLDFRWKSGWSANLRSSWSRQRIDYDFRAGEPDNLALAHLAASYTRTLRGHEWTPYISIFNATNRRTPELVDLQSHIALRRTFTVGARAEF